eukprot:TRINITY_DN101825_c0_g1_i1.p1 TRINITY_DN101825_c0_g1~~TRINITY_DN101825_c0_g1_i1.p1  ORF type:complete len:221 (-),score=16.47 TRINITY_DN101825_c0_g1_i1:25-687(-)
MQKLPPLSWIACATFLGDYVATSASDQVGDSCDWESVDGRTLTAAEFELKYFEKKPVLLTHLIDDWPALKEGRWAENKILERYGEYVFDTSHIAPNCLMLAKLPRHNFSLAEYMNATAPSSWFIYGFHPMVEDMKRSGDWNIPDILGFVRNSGPQLSIGRNSQGNIFHQHETNWLAQVYGRKRWLVYNNKDDKHNQAPSDTRRKLRLAGDPCAPQPDWPG